MGIKLAVVGAGAFGRQLIPLFKAHPLVDDIGLADLDERKLQAACRDFGIAKSYPSFEAILESNVDTVAIISQHWLHAEQAVQAMRAGKHVFSAVPAALTVDEVESLVRTVEETGQIYGLGAVGCYFPWIMYCRQRYQAGAFGKVVYAEADYYHDLEQSLLEVFKWRGGERWREDSVIPPMFYPMHCTSGIISTLGAHMTHVSSQGFEDHDPDGAFEPRLNRWQNAFSNESALYKMSDGSLARVNVFWRVAHPGTNRVSMFGTLGSFELNSAGAMWVNREPGVRVRLDDQLLPAWSRPSWMPGQDSSFKRPDWMSRPKWIRPEWVPSLIKPRRGIPTEAGDVFLDLAPAQPTEMLPREFANIPLVSGESGTNYYIVHEFVRAVAAGKHPYNNVWMAARYMLPGIMAHESARRGGENLSIPDFGPPPKSVSVDLDYLRAPIEG